MQNRIRHWTILGGVAILLAASLIGLVSCPARTRRPTPPPNVVEPHRPGSLTTSSSSPQGVGDHGDHQPKNGEVPRVALVRPEKPLFSTLTDPILAQLQGYMQELWIYSADRMLQEIDQLCASRGPEAALDYIRGLVSAEAYLQMPSSDTFRPFHVAESATLATFDFERWFRSLLAVRLIPHVVERHPSPELLRSATETLLAMVRDTKDPFLARFAAGAFGEAEAFVMPEFCFVHQRDGGPPIGLAIDFNTSSPSYPQTKGFTEAHDTLERLATPLAPMLNECPWATEQMVHAIVRCADDKAKRLLLHEITSLPDWQLHGSTFLRLAADPKEDIWVRDDTLRLLKPYASSRQLRDAVEQGIAPSTESSLRVMFLEHLPELYPADHRFCDVLQGLVRSDSEDPLVRLGAAKALAAYSVGQIPNPEYSTTVDGYLTDLANRGNWSDFRDISDQIVSLHAIQFLGTYRNILQSLESPSHHSMDTDSAKVEIRSYIEQMEQADDR